MTLKIANTLISDHIKKSVTPAFPVSQGFNWPSQPPHHHGAAATNKVEDAPLILSSVR
jgi:hypothetical protein